MRQLTIAVLLTLAVAAPLVAAPSEVRLSAQPGLAETVSQAMTRQAVEPEPVDTFGVEAGILKGLHNFGDAGASISVWTIVSPDLPFIGKLFGGHKAFVDFIASTEDGSKGYIGGSVSLKPAVRDDHLRFGVKAIGGGGFSAYLRLGTDLNIGF
jgi:hypothetical protein